jgi:hypothetical protein
MSRGREAMRNESRGDEKTGREIQPGSLGPRVAFVAFVAIVAHRAEDRQKTAQISALLCLSSAELFSP